MKLKEPDLMTSQYHQRCDGQLYIYKDRAQVSRHASTVYFPVTSDERGVHIATHGYLDINNTGDRDPDVRAIYQREFGVGCDKASEFAGLLICPHTGKEVKVSRINNNPVLWLDYEHGIAIKSLRIRYATPTSPPENTVECNVMHYSFSNQKRYNTLKKHWLALQPEVKLRCEIAGSMQVGWPNHKVKELLLDHPEATTVESLCDIAKTIDGFDLDDVARMQQVVMSLKTYQINSDAAKMLCADRYETTYFKIKE